MSTDYEVPSNFAVITAMAIATNLVLAFQKIQEKRRNGLLMHWGYDRLTTALSRLGVTVEASLTYREEGRDLAPPKPRLTNFTWGIATHADLPALADVRGETGSYGEFAERAGRGAQCYLLRESGRIVAFIWCEVGGPPRPRFGLSFGPRDAYVFDAYTISSHRGLNLLPFLKYQVLQDLTHRGCDNILTATDIFNGAAQRYKRKLGAKPLALKIFLGLPGGWGRAFTLYRVRETPIAPTPKRELPTTVPVA